MSIIYDGIYDVEGDFQKRSKNELGFQKPVDVCGGLCYVNTVMVIDNHHGGEMLPVTTGDSFLVYRL